MPLVLTVDTLPGAAEWVDSGIISGVPPVANVQGATIVEDPAGTRISRRLREADIDPDFAISTFARSVGGLIEVGDTLATPLAFTASYTQSPTAASVIDDQGGTAQDVSGTATAFSYANGGPYTVTAVNGQVGWTLTASEVGGATAQTTATWSPRTFYGTGIAGQSSEAFIEALLNQQLDTNRQITFTLSPASKKVYYCFPNSYGTPTFTVGGFSGGFTKTATTTVTNVFGVAILYAVWESDQLLTGTDIQFVVT